MKRSAVLWLLTALVLIAIFQSPVGRLLSVDVTEENLYTIAGGTEDFLENLTEPITVRLYYSKALGQHAPQYGAYADRVVEVLQRFSQIAGDNVVLHVHNPTPFSKEEDEAISIGLKGVRGPAGDKMYFGMLATTEGAARQVASFFPIERAPYLEYDLAQTLYKLTKPEKPVLGVLTTLPILGAGPFAHGSGPWFVIDQLRAFYDVQPVSVEGESVPASIDILMVIQPVDLPDTALRALDAYALSGGRIMMFVDPYVEVLQRPGSEGDTVVLSSLLSAWGVSMSLDKFVADAALGRRVTADVGGYERDVRYYGWLGVTRDQLDEQDVINADIDLINMASVGAFSVAEGVQEDRDLTITPLMHSSEDAMLMDISYVHPTPDVARIIQDFAPSNTQNILALKIDGPVGSAFSDVRGEEAAHIILVADVDMLHEAFWMQKGQIMGQAVAIPTAHNGIFVQNAVGFLSGESALMGLRPRAVRSRGLTVLSDMQADAEARYQSKEQEVRQKMDIAESKLNDLLQASGEGGALFTEQKRTLIDNLQTDLVRLREELRDIQRALREDALRLAQQMWFINIVAAPLLLLAVAFLVLRRSRKIRFF